MKAEITIARPHAVVLGAAGFLGSTLVRRLVQNNVDLTAIDPAFDHQIIPPNISAPTEPTIHYRVTLSDLTIEPGAVLINCMAPAPLSPHTKTVSNEPYFMEQLLRVTPSTATIIQISHLLARPDPSCPYLQGKWETESLLRTRHPSHIIIRPSLMFGYGAQFFPRLKGWIQQQHRNDTVVPEHRAIRPVCVDDVIRLLVGIVGNAQAHLGKCYSVVGPETFRLCDVAARFDALSHPPKPLNWNLNRTKPANGITPESVLIHEDIVQPCQECEEIPREFMPTTFLSNGEVRRCLAGSIPRGSRFYSQVPSAA